MNPRRNWAISLFVSAALLVVLSRMVDFQALANAWKSSDPRWFAAALTWAGVAIVLRTIRLRQLLTARGRPSPPFWRALRATCLHQGLFGILPSGAGDLALPLIARTYLNRDTAEAIAALLIMRAQDAASLFAICTPCVIVWTDFPGAELIAALLAVLGIASIAAVQPGVRWTGQWVARSVSGHAQSGTGWRGALARGASALTGRLPDTATSNRRFTFLFALGAWLATAAGVDASFRAFGAEIPFAAIGIILLALNLIGAAAILTVAGIGLVEPGLAGILALLKIAPDGAIVLAVAVRAVLLISNVGLPLVIEGLAAVIPVRPSSTRQKS